MAEGEEAEPSPEEDPSAGSTAVSPQAPFPCVSCRRVNAVYGRDSLCAMCLPAYQIPGLVRSLGHLTDSQAAAVADALQAALVCLEAWSAVRQPES